MTTASGSATPVRDSNAADSGQPVEIVEVATDDCYRPEMPLERHNGIERSKSLPEKNLLD